MEEKKSKEPWTVYVNDATGKEILSHTVRGTFPGEIKNTIKLLAYEKGIPAEQIRVYIENR